jgi:hypothetical protein
MLDKFLRFVQGRLDQTGGAGPRRLVTLHDLLQTEHNAPFRQVCADNGAATLEVCQRVCNKLLLKQEAEATIVNRETVAQFQKANSKRLRRTTRLRRQAQEVAAMNDHATTTALSFSEIRAEGLAHGHAIMQELKKPLLDVVAGNRQRLSYEDRKIAAGLLPAMLALKKPCRGINLSCLKLNDREALTRAYTHSNGVFTLAQGKESCRDTATFLIIDEDIVAFLDFHCDVVRKAIVASCLQSRARGKQSPVAADVNHAFKIYKLPQDEYFLAAKDAGVPPASHGGRNKFKDIFDYFPPSEHGWRTKRTHTLAPRLYFYSHCVSILSI